MYNFFFSNVIMSETALLIDGRTTKWTAKKPVASFQILYPKKSHLYVWDIRRPLILISNIKAAYEFSLVLDSPPNLILRIVLIPASQTVLNFHSDYKSGNIFRKKPVSPALRSPRTSPPRRLLALGSPLPLESIRCALTHSSIMHLFIYTSISK